MGERATVVTDRVVHLVRGQLERAERLVVRGIVASRQRRGDVAFGVGGASHGEVELGARAEEHRPPAGGGGPVREFEPCRDRARGRAVIVIVDRQIADIGEHPRDEQRALQFASEQQRFFVDSLCLLPAPEVLIGNGHVVERRIAQRIAVGATDCLSIIIKDAVVVLRVEIDRADVLQGRRFAAVVVPAYVYVIGQLEIGERLLRLAPFAAQTPARQQTDRR